MLSQGTYYLIYITGHYESFEPKVYEAESLADIFKFCGENNIGITESTELSSLDEGFIIRGTLLK